jgi:hypothetical protein
MAVSAGGARALGCRRSGGRRRRLPASGSGRRLESGRALCPRPGARRRDAPHRPDAARGRRRWDGRRLRHPRALLRREVTGPRLRGPDAVSRHEGGRPRGSRQGRDRAGLVPDDLGSGAAGADPSRARPLRRGAPRAGIRSRGRADARTDDDDPPLRDDVLLARVVGDARLRRVHRALVGASRAAPARARLLRRPACRPRRDDGVPRRGDRRDPRALRRREGRGRPPPAGVRSGSVHRGPADPPLQPLGIRQRVRVPLRERHSVRDEQDGPLRDHDPQVRRPRSSSCSRRSDC